MTNLTQMSKGMLSCCLNAFSCANIQENSTRLPFFFNIYSSRIRKASVHFTLLIRLTGHLISNLVVSRSMIRSSPEDKFAELTEGLCHRLLRCLLHPPNQSWFLISHSQVHREDTDTSNQSRPQEPGLRGWSPHEASSCARRSRGFSGSSSVCDGSFSDV